MRGELFLPSTGVFVCLVYAVKIHHQYFSGTVHEHVTLDLSQQHELRLTGSPSLGRFRLVSLWTLRHPGCVRLNGRLAADDPLRD